MSKKPERGTALIDKDLIDACKSLFANICFTKVDEDIKTICVTSALASEGKSTTSLNLALAIAESGKKTLLVENDMRKRTLARALQIAGENDICDLIRGNVSIMDAVVPTTYENLYFLDVAPGVPSPPDILSSERYAKLVERLKERFDYVIFDTPPVMLFVDAAIVSSLVDGTVLVIKEKSTKKTIANKALAQLRKANANIVGVSMSCCQIHRDDYYYYSYYSVETGERVARSSSHSSSRLDLSEIDRKEQPVWDVDYDEEKEHLPQRPNDGIEEPISGTASTSNRQSVSASKRSSHSRNRKR